MDGPFDPGSSGLGSASGSPDRGAVRAVVSGGEIHLNVLPYRPDAVARIRTLPGGGAGRAAP